MLLEFLDSLPEISRFSSSDFVLGGARLVLAFRPTLFDLMRRVEDDDALLLFAGLCPSDGCNSALAPDLRVDCKRRIGGAPEASAEEDPVPELLVAAPFGGSPNNLSAAAARRLLLAPPDFVRAGAVLERGILRPVVGRRRSSSSSLISLHSSSSSVGAVLSDPVLLRDLGRCCCCCCCCC